MKSKMQKIALALAFVAMSAGSALAEGDEVAAALTTLQGKITGWVTVGLAAVVVVIGASAGFFALKWLFRQMKGGAASASK